MGKLAAADDLEWKLLCNELLPRVVVVEGVGLRTTLTYLLPTVLIMIEMITKEQRRGKRLWYDAMRSFVIRTGEENYWQVWYIAREKHITQVKVWRGGTGSSSTIVRITRRRPSKRYFWPRCIPAKGCASSHGADELQLIINSYDNYRIFCLSPVLLYVVFWWQEDSQHQRSPINQILETMPLFELLWRCHWLASKATRSAITQGGICCHVWYEDSLGIYVRSSVIDSLSPSQPQKRYWRLGLWRWCQRHCWV